MTKIDFFLGCNVSKYKNLSRAYSRYSPKHTSEHRYSSSRSTDAAASDRPAIDSTYLSTTTTTTAAAATNATATTECCQRVSADANAAAQIYFYLYKSTIVGGSFSSL